MFRTRNVIKLIDRWIWSIQKKTSL